VILSAQTWGDVVRAYQSGKNLTFEANKFIQQLDKLC